MSMSCVYRTNVEILTISAEDLNRMKNNPNMVIINVLDPLHYAECHISPSVNIPLKELVSAIRRYPKDQSIVVYCANSVCPASKDAYQKLKHLGYTNVRAYEGGMQEWRAKGFACEGTQVH